MATHSSILENHMDRGDWKVHGVMKSQTQLETDHAHVCVCLCVCVRTHTQRLGQLLLTIPLFSLHSLIAGCESPFDSLILSNSSKTQAHQDMTK